MARYARIAAGLVAEIVTLPDEVEPDAAFHPDFVATLVACSDPAVAEGWLWDGEAFAAPPVIPPTAAALTAYAAAVRYTVEVAGVSATIGGAPVTVTTARDMRDGMRDTMLAIMVGLRKDGAALKIFADGVPRPASNAEAEAAISAAFAHVQGAFDVEAALYPQIAAGAIATRAAIDAAAWPPLPA